MKTPIIKISFLLAFVLLGYIAVAQDSFVSKKIQKQTTLYEEITGAACPNCARGHKKIEDIKAKYTGVVAINIHQGGFALPARNTYDKADYRTKDGDTIVLTLASIYDDEGGQIKFAYPSAAINRTVNAVDNKMYTVDANYERVAQDNQNKNQIVNVAIKSTIDTIHKEITAIVEVYYTASSDSATNRLSLALIQDSVIGYQNNNTLNPDYIVNDSLYMHMHMLRDLISDRWGDTIQTTTEGFLWRKEYKYSIPDTIGTLPTVPKDLRLVAFVTERKYGKVLASAYSNTYLGIDKCVSGKEGVDIKLLISPNPAKENVNITFDLQKEIPLQISIYNSLGKEVIHLPKKKYSKGTQNVNVETFNLPSGIYIVRIETSEGITAKKLVITK